MLLLRICAVHLIVCLSFSSVSLAGAREAKDFDNCRDSLRSADLTLENILTDYEYARKHDKGKRRLYDRFLKNHLPESKNFEISATRIGPTEAYKAYLDATRLVHLSNSSLQSLPHIRSIAVAFQRLLRLLPPDLKQRAFVLIGGSLPNGHATTDSDMDGAVYPANLLRDAGISQEIRKNLEQPGTGMGLRDIFEKFEMTSFDPEEDVLTNRFLIRYCDIQPFVLKITPMTVELMHPIVHPKTPRASPFDPKFMDNYVIERNTHPLDWK